VRGAGHRARAPTAAVAPAEQQQAPHAPHTVNSGSTRELRELQREGGEGMQRPHKEGEQRGGGEGQRRPNVTPRTNCKPVAGSSLLPDSMRGQATCSALGEEVQHSAQASAGSLAGRCG
jgi:hypothetical protein